MNTPSTSLLAPPLRRSPNFSGRPRRINLEQIVAVKGHGKLNIRPIRPEDEQEMILFHTSLSEENIYMRYFEYLGLDRRTSHERLIRICTNIPESYAIVVERSADLAPSRCDSGRGKTYHDCGALRCHL